MKNKKLSNRIIYSILLLAVFVNNINGQTYEQQQRLSEYLNNNNKIYGFSKQVLDEVLNEHKDFFGNYADALIAVDLANKFANAQDKALLETIVIEASKKGMEKVFPTLAKALGWASWAKTGMELLDQFVVNPARMGSSLNDYYNKRDAGWDRGEAIAMVYDWGNVLVNLKKDFRKQYGDLVFDEITPSSLTLLPRWENRFDRFVDAYFEAEYIKYKVKKETEKILKSRGKELSRGEGKLIKWLEKKQKELDKRKKCNKNEHWDVDEKDCECNAGYTENSGEDCVKIKDCDKNEHFDADEEDCECDEGYEENEDGICVKVPECPDKEEWSEEVEDCICVEGYVKNEDDACVPDEVEDEEEMDECSIEYINSLAFLLEVLVADTKLNETELISYINKFNKEINDQSSDPCDNSIIAYCYYSATEVAARMAENVIDIHDITVEIIMLQAMCPDLNQQMQGKGLTIKSLISSIAGLGSYKEKISQMESRLRENGCDEDEVKDDGEKIVPPEGDPGFIQDGGISTEMPGDGVDNDGDGQQDEEIQGLTGYNVTLVLYDSGSAADDVFNLYVEGYGNLGQTPAGGLRSYGLNLLPGTYNAVVTVVIAPDDVGTYTLTVLYNGESIGSITGSPPQGSSATLSFTVPSE